MTITDIENLSFAELKAKRVELIEAAKAVPLDDLAARYVQARTDATARDEKLAEQGKTIIALQDGLAAAKQQNGSLQETLQQRNQAAANLSAQVSAKEDTCAAQLKELQAERRRAERLKAVAILHHRAVSQAAKLLNNALAAAAIDEADKGEA